MAASVNGSITNRTQANHYLENDGLDAATVGKAFRKNPGAVWKLAEELAVEVKVADQTG